MTNTTDTLDLGALRLTSGEGRRLELLVAVEPFELAGETYAVEPERIPVRLDVSRMTGQGYALRTAFEATLVGSCMRCLDPARADFKVEAREVSQPSFNEDEQGVAGAGKDELDSPYVQGGLLDLAAWTRDALALNLPAAILCRPDCAGLCPVCGVNLNGAGPDHHHEAERDPRWAKLSDLKFDSE